MLSLCPCPETSHPSFPVPGANCPPKPWAQGLPCRIACSLVYEGQAGTGPLSRQGAGGRHCGGHSCPDPVPASREPAGEVVGGRGHHLRANLGQRVMGHQEQNTAPGLPGRQESPESSGFHLELGVRKEKVVTPVPARAEKPSEPCPSAWTQNPMCISGAGFRETMRQLLT